MPTEATDNLTGAEYDLLQEAESWGRALATGAEPNTEALKECALNYFYARLLVELEHVQEKEEGILVSLQHIESRAKETGYNLR